MGVVTSTIKVAYAKVVSKLYDITQWDKLRQPASDAKMLIWRETRHSYDYGDIPAYHLPVSPQPVTYPKQDIPLRPIYRPQTTYAYNKCENGGCTNEATRQLTMTAGTNSLRAKTCNSCYSSKKSQMEWDLRCYSSSYSWY
tara:strand:+ start:154 stop:576 length:423 start_codon:yes stop_codon:yes gene_type:complete